ncbi:hypothetical protein B0H34DRAFT_800478 [Crassisporium funariophilum]|nr:hypothetical protein B0H34DRAFT_800478 [Crassisporium funariophilum]
MNNFTIDDRDQSISYSVGQWVQKGMAKEFKSSTTETWTAGATAQLSFYGTNISVWGTIGIKGPAAESMYSIDQGVPATFTGTQIPKTTQYQQQFFQSEQLSLTNHTLIITNLIDDDELYLDYILVGLPGPSASQTVSTAASVTPSSSSVMPLPSLPSVSGERGVTGSISSSDVGMIVGAVIGEIVFLLLAIFVLRKRYRSKEPAIIGQDSSTGGNFLSRLRKPKLHGITPFLQHVTSGAALPRSKSHVLLQEYRTKAVVQNTPDPRSTSQHQNPHESSLHLSPVHGNSVGPVPCDTMLMGLPPRYDAIDTQ